MVPVQERHLIQNHIVLGADRAGKKLDAGAVASRRDIRPAEEYPKIIGGPGVPGGKLMVRQAHCGPDVKFFPPLGRLPAQGIIPAGLRHFCLLPGRRDRVTALIGRTRGNVESECFPWSCGAQQECVLVSERARSFADYRQRGRAGFRTIGHNHQSIGLLDADSVPLRMLFRVETLVQIDPNILVDAHAHLKGQWGIGSVCDPNRQNPFGRNQDLPMALKCVRASLAMVRPNQVGPEAQIYGEEPTGDIQIMPETRHLSGFDVLAVTTGQVKGEMTMSFLVPPVLIREVRQVLEPAVCVYRTRSRHGKSVGADPHDRSPQSQAFILILGMAKALQSLFHKRRLLNGLLPCVRDSVGCFHNSSD